jgi:cob(I)alamin adenosyltransferase
MAKLYTKTGDDGTTSLTNKKRVSKNSEVIEVYGSLDELNSFLGFAAESLCQKEKLQSVLRAVYRIQRELFGIGSQIISGEKFNFNLQLINKLEEEVDNFEAELPVLKAFILPGGGECSSRFHLARSVCRRAERAACALSAASKGGNVAEIYLNRLSDWLFVVARYVAFVENIESTTA